MRRFAGSGLREAFCRALRGGLNAGQGSSDRGVRTAAAWRQESASVRNPPPPRFAPDPTARASRCNADGHGPRGSAWPRLSDTWPNETLRPRPSLPRHGSTIVGDGGMHLVAGAVNRFAHTLPVGGQRTAGRRRVDPVKPMAGVLRGDGDPMIEPVATAWRGEIEIAVIDRRRGGQRIDRRAGEGVYAGPLLAGGIDGDRRAGRTGRRDRAAPRRRSAGSPAWRSERG